MSEYTQQEQTEIVREAMTLTAEIKIQKEELARLKKEQFKSKPNAPQRQVLNVPLVQPQLPAPPKSNYPFTAFLKENLKWIIAIFGGGAGLMIISFVTALTGSQVLSIIGGIMGIIGFLPFFFFLFILIFAYYKYRQKRDAFDKQLAASPEYQNAVSQAQQAAAEEQERLRIETAWKQKNIDAEYEAAKEKYDTETIPTYQHELAVWKENTAKKIELVQQDIEVNTETLETLYDTTKLVSLTYRELWILRWLYDDMRTSDHDIRYATELLDRNRQLLATEQSGRMVREAVGDLQSEMSSGFASLYAAVEDGNEELIRMRHDQNMAATMGVIQRHNLNRKMKKQNKMIEDYFNK